MLSHLIEVLVSLVWNAVFLITVSIAYIMSIFEVVLILTGPFMRLMALESHTQSQVIKEVLRKQN